MVLELTMIGSGGPMPAHETKGTSVSISIDNEQLLFDCGPGTVEGLLDNRIHPGTIERLFFTHHHMDHNASFFHFAISSWMVGRQSLEVYGPEGTDVLVDALERIYAEDFAYRADLGRDLEPVTEIATRIVDESFELRTESWTVTAHAVDHSIETYAYRIEDRSDGSTVVISGDTAPEPSLAAFAEGANVLVHDAIFGPIEESLPTGELLWHSSLSPSDTYRDVLGKNHCTPAEAAEVATEADVDTLVLTHLMPYRDVDAMRSEAASVFDGTVIVATDGLTLTSPF